MTHTLHIISLFKKITATLCACLFLFACENDVKEVRALGTKTLGVEEGKNIESFLSNSGKMKAKLTTPVMLRYLYDSPRIEFPKRLHVDFYDTLTTIESQLNARYGRYLENDNKVFLRDSVVVFNRKHDTLWCDELYWDQYKGTFHTDKPVVLSQANPRQKIYSSKGLDADQNFTWFTLHEIGRNYTGKESFINVPDSVSNKPDSSKKPVPALTPVVAPAKVIPH